MAISKFASPRIFENRVLHIETSSFFLLLVAMDSRRMISTMSWAAASALAGYMSLWSYESPLPVMLAFPFTAALLRRDVPLSRLFCAQGIYVLPVVAFIGENVQRYLASGGGERLFDLTKAPEHIVRFIDGGHDDLDMHGALHAVRRFLAWRFGLDLSFPL
jgi:hypothetical protein